MSPRLVVLVCLLAGLVGLSVAVARHADEPRPSRSLPAVGDAAVVPARAQARQRAGVARAARVLSRWDRQRAAAYAAGDPSSLRSLYARGSAAGTADVRVLRSYAARGLVVERLRMQLIELRVMREARDRMVLRVQDRLATAEVVSAAGRWRLPADRPTTRSVTLVRSGKQWVVGAVRER